MRNILVVNHSKHVGPADFSAGLRAARRQLLEHFLPIWPDRGPVDLIASAGDLLPTDEAITLLDPPQDDGALGYHTRQAGQPPRGYVFPLLSARHGQRWEVALSHELLEQVVDPDCDLLVPCSYRGPAWLALEVCDPVEADTYLLDGVPVSNFLLPAWFGAPIPAGSVARYDYLGLLPEPFRVNTGGYLSLTRDGRNWEDVAAYRSHRHRRRRVA